jgi:hypothetical protein
MQKPFRIFLTAAVLAAVGWGLLEQLRAQDTEQARDPKRTESEAEMRRAEDVFRHHQQELDKHPDVFGAFPYKGTIVITTDRPDTMPKEIDGVQVVIEAPEPHLPPPSGLILLKADGTREHQLDLSECPGGYTERRVYRWRFCNDSGTPQPIPGDIMAPPVAGIPYQEAEAIVNRNTEWVMKLPGVVSFGLTAEGLRVETNHPELIPSYIEGLPVIILPVTRLYVPSNHSTGTRIRPMRGAVAAINPQGAATGLTFGTIGGIMLSEGKPWVLFPAHAIDDCGDFSDCLASPLNACPHYTGDMTLDQPLQTVPELIARIPIWSRMPPNGTVLTDVAAGFMDNDTTEGNSSIVVSRGELHGSVVPLKGTEGVVASLNPLRIVTAVDEYTDTNLPGSPTFTAGHILLATVTTSSTSITSRQPCLGGIIPPPVTYNQVFEYTEDNGVYVLPGTSGALITHRNTGDILGIQTHRAVDAQTGYPLNIGIATRIANARIILSYDNFYGTDTVNDNSFGTYRPSQGRWYLDNGNGQWQSTTPGEWQIHYGTNGDRAVTGVWQPGGARCIGVYRPSQGRFYLDYNCDGVTDAHMTLGTNGDIPVAGDWNNDGVTELGVWRPSTKTFYLDFNGNKVWNGCSVDKCFTYGFSTDKPVAGNWVGSPGNAAKTGVYRPSEGKWYLEKENNGWVTGQEIVVGPFGLSDDKLVVGNWTGVGTKDKIGVFHTTGGGIVPPATWVLDNGDGAFTSYQREQRLGSFGLAEDQPVAWRKTVWKGN